MLRKKALFHGPSGTVFTLRFHDTLDAREKVTRNFAGRASQIFQVGFTTLETGGASREAAVPLWYGLHHLSSCIKVTYISYYRNLWDGRPTWFALISSSIWLMWKILKLVSDIIQVRFDCGLLFEARAVWKCMLNGAKTNWRDKPNYIDSIIQISSLIS